MRIDARLLDARLFGRWWRRLVARLLLLRLFVPLPRLFGRRLFRARLELVDAALLLGEGSGCGRVLLERAPFTRTVAAIAVAAAAVAPSAALLFAFALGPRSVPLGRKLMELRRFA